MCKYSTHARKEDHEAGSLETMQQRVASRSWFTLSICPLDYGWKPDDRLGVTPINIKTFAGSAHMSIEPWDGRGTMTRGTIPTPRPSGSLGQRVDYSGMSWVSAARPRQWGTSPLHPGSGRRPRSAAGGLPFSPLVLIYCKLCGESIWLAVPGSRMVRKREKINRVKNSAHRAWQEFSLLDELMYCKMMISLVISPD